MTILIPHIVIWAVLATIVVFLAAYRRSIRLKADELLHVLDTEAPLVSNQAVVAKRLEKVNRWGKILTALVILYALAVAAYYFYTVFQDTSVRMG